MLRRVIDLSLKVSPTSPAQISFPPKLPDREETGAERGRVEMQKMGRIEPYQLDGHPDEVFMDVIIGHSTPHTHVDIFMHDWYTMFADVPRDKKWTQRDVSQIPTHEIVGPASIVDISDVAPGETITLEFFKSRANHIHPGDMVFVKTGHPEIYEGYKKIGKTPEDLSVITPEIGEWLAKECRMRVYGHDAVVNGNFRRWMKTEQLFYRNGVLMIDRMAHMDRVQGGTRVFANVGLSFKMAGVDDSPARVMVLPNLDTLSGQTAIDLYDPIKLPLVAEGPPFQRTEPFELKSEIMKRLRVRTFHIPMAEYQMEEDGWVGFKAFSNHLGTHIEVPSLPLAGRPLPDSAKWDLSTVDSNRLWGPASVVDAWCAGPRQNVTASILNRQGKHVREGDIVIIRTGFTDDYYHRSDFLKFTPGFSPCAIEWLVDKGVKMLVTDSASIEPSPHGFDPVFKDNHYTLFSNGIPDVVCATELWRLQHNRSVAFVSPMALRGLNASPCRVVVVEDWA